MVTTAREPRAYEIMAVFLPEMADEDLAIQLDRAGGYITNVGGTIKEVLTDSPWGRRRLAYPVRFNNQDFRDGYYAVYHFDLAPSAMVEVERELKLDTRVMRYLVVHDDPKAGERNTGRPEAGAGTEDAPVTVAPAGEESARAPSSTESTDVATAAAPTDSSLTAPAAAVESTPDTAQGDPVAADEPTGALASETAETDEAAPPEDASADMAAAAPADEVSPPEQSAADEVAVPAPSEDVSTDSNQEDES